MKTKYHSTPSAADARSHDGTQNNSIRRKRSALALRGFFLASIFALSVSSVKAQCPQGWDAGGMWGLKQSNQGAPNQMDLRQNGVAIMGTASFTGIKKKKEPGLFGKFGESGLIQGTVDGTVKGDTFYVKIVWDNQAIGVYDGKIGPQGQLTGTGYEIKSPSKKVNWSSDRAMKCAQTPAPPRPPPIKSTGHMPAKTTPSPTPARPKP